MANLTKMYRPHRFDDVVGQDNVVKFLKRQSQEDKFSNVYICYGHFGCGKTTIARIVAMAANCQNKDSEGNPCGECENCKKILNHNTVDFVELDAASRSSVDDTRALIESTAYCPIDLDKKVYIIDEVHRLSGSAFDSLLKTLEEPPEYAIFMLCTTAYNAIPSTIASRATKLNFKAIPSDKMAEKLKDIAAEQGREVEDEAISLLVRSANGALRDGEMNLEQAFRYTSETVTVSVIEEMLAVTGEDTIVNVIECILKGDADKVIALAHKLNDESNDLGSLIKGCQSLLCDSMQYSRGYTDIIKEQSEIRCEHIKKIAGICDDVYKYRYLDKAMNALKGELKKEYSFDVFLNALLDMTLEKDSGDISMMIDRLMKENAQLSDRLKLIESGVSVKRADKIIDELPAKDAAKAGDIGKNDESKVVEPLLNIAPLTEEPPMPPMDYYDNMGISEEQESLSPIKEAPPEVLKEAPEQVELKAREENKEEIKETPKTRKPVFTFDEFDGYIFGTPSAPKATSAEEETEDKAPTEEEIPLTEFEATGAFFEEEAPKPTKSFDKVLAVDKALKDTVEKMCVVSRDDGKIVISTPFGEAYNLVSTCLEVYNLTEVCEIAYTPGLKI